MRESLSRHSLLRSAFSLSNSVFLCSKKIRKTYTIIILNSMRDSTPKKINKFESNPERPPIKLNSKASPSEYPFMFSSKAKNRNTVIVTMMNLNTLLNSLIIQYLLLLHSLLFAIQLLR